MITLTDGNKTIVLTKKEMETVEDSLRELRWPYYKETVNTILTKLEGLKYE